MVLVHSNAIVPPVHTERVAAKKTSGRCTGELGDFASVIIRSGAYTPQRFYSPRSQACKCIYLVQQQTRQSQDWRFWTVETPDGGPITSWRANDTCRATQNNRKVIGDIAGCVGVGWFEWDGARQCQVFALATRVTYSRRGHVLIHESWCVFISAVLCLLSINWHVSR